MANKDTVIPDVDALPPLSKELMEYLQAVFPQKFKHEYELKDYHIRIGRQEVIDLLWRIYNHQKG